MGVFKLGKRQGVAFRSTVDAAWPQGFALYRRRKGHAVESLGFYRGGSAAVFAGFPEETSYAVVGYHNRGGWKASRQIQTDKGSCVVFKHDDSYGDGDFNDLIVVGQRLRASEELFEVRVGELSDEGNYPEVVFDD